MAAAIVLGERRTRDQEAVKAIVVLREGAEADAGVLDAFCKGRLAGFKRPRSFDFIEALPRNASGKVLKKDLREKYWEGHGRRVS